MLSGLLQLQDETLGCMVSGVSLSADLPVFPGLRQAVMNAIQNLQETL